MSPFTDPPAVVGHRGAPTLAPQNTPASFLAAAEEGASWVELDVRRSADDVLVCQHDPVDAEGRPLVEQTAADLAAAHQHRLHPGGADIDAHHIAHP